MICELQIKLGTGKTPLHYHSNHFVYEIERVCDSKDRYKLFEAYTKASVDAAANGRLCDSILHKSQQRATKKDEEAQYAEETGMRQEVTQVLPLLETLLHSDKDNFESNFIKLRQNFAASFRTFFHGA